MCTLFDRHRRRPTITNDSPCHIQYHRGQLKPPNTELVCRPYRFGNPFDWRIYGHQRAVELFAAWIVNPNSQPITCGAVIYHPATLDVIRARLAGKNLACYCEPEQPCHADILLMLANPTRREAKSTGVDPWGVNP